MISKVIEEAMENMVRRIEALEEFKKYYSNQRPPKQFKLNQKPQKTGSSTPEQLNYIRTLNGNPDPSISKQEASDEIDRLLKEKESREFEKELEKIEEPKEVDTDDAGLDEEDLI